MNFESGDYFANLISDLEERLRGIELFERDEVIQAYCDDLESQVILSYDSAIKSLNEQRDRQLEVIGSYRRMLLVPSDFNLKTPDRTECAIASLVNNNWITIQKTKKETPNLARLKKELDALKRSLMSEQKGDVDSIQTQLNGMKTRITALRKLMREEAFFGVFPRFKVNRLFDLQCNQVGVMSFGSEEKALDLSKGRTTELKLELKHSLSIRRLQTRFTFLSDGSLITICEDKADLLKVDMQEGAILNQVKLDSSQVSSIALLRDNYLAIGLKTGIIIIWYLTTMKSVRVLKGHGRKKKDCPFFSLLVLSNGKLASAGCDHRIIIWDPFVDAPHCLLQTLHKAPNYSMFSFFGLLSNGYLVVCSVFSKTWRIEVWDVENGNVVREMPIEIEKEAHLLVLSNDQVVVGTFEGQFRAYDVVERTLVSSWTMKGAKIYVSSIHRLPDDFVLVACGVDSKPSAQIWDPFKGVLVQSIAVDHSIGHLWAKVSLDFKTLVTSSDDDYLKIWSISGLNA